MKSPVVTVVLSVAVFFSLASLAPRLGRFRLPGDQQGYAPVQPIAYSHRLHAGELEIPCLYCHSAAQTSRHAGIPPANVCMNCHRFVTATQGAVQAEDERAKAENRPPRLIRSVELEKLYNSLELDSSMKPDPTRKPQPIEWIRVHKLPDYVYFDHRAHVSAGVQCQDCHGPIETMERVRQVKDLSMGWCVNCHRGGVDVGGRKVTASVDCQTCHF